MSNSQSADNNENVSQNRDDAQLPFCDSGLRVDCSFLRTKFGLLRIAQLTCILLGAITFTRGVLELHKTLHGVVIFMSLGLFLYAALVGVVSPFIFVSMMFPINYDIIFFNKSTWFNIELVLCPVSAFLCCLNVFISIYYTCTLSSMVMFLSAIFSTAPVFLFGYNFYLLNKKRSGNNPPLRINPVSSINDTYV